MRSGVAVLMLMMAAQLVAEEGGSGVPAPPLAVPDVRGNVMRMLEASRHSGEGHSDKPATPPVIMLPEGDSPPPAAAMSPTIPAEARPLAQPSPDPVRGGGPPPPPRVTAPRRDNHVPLEQKEVTIKSLDDIRRLSEELKGAKRRQGTQSPPE